MNDAAPAAEALRSAGAEVTVLPAAGEHVDLAALLAHLGERGINELHAECGATLAGALLNAGLVDELVIYLAPVLLGPEARPLAALKEISGMAERLELRLDDLRAVGNDLRLTATPISKG